LKHKGEQSITLPRSSANTEERFLWIIFLLMYDNFSLSKWVVQGQASSEILDEISLRKILNGRSNTQRVDVLNSIDATC
jgi:hypothetical protein